MLSNQSVLNAAGFKKQNNIQPPWKSEPSAVTWRKGAGSWPLPFLPDFEKKD